MKIERILTPSDQARVDDTLERLASRLNRQAALSDLLDDWRKFVVAVKQGYQWSMESYTRDLAVRDLIEEISEGLSMDGRRLVAIAVKDIDDDFIEATHDPDQPEDSDSAGLEIAWWQFRIPKKPQGKLLDDMKKMGMKIFTDEAGHPEKQLPDTPSPRDYEAPPGPSS